MVKYRFPSNGCNTRPHFNVVSSHFCIFLLIPAFMIWNSIIFQVNITQDSLQSFLKVADKLKIKGLCERGTLIPEGVPFHNTITIPLKEDKSKPTSILPHPTFETLLPRSPFLEQTSLSGQILPSIRQNIVSSAPPAHQAPKNTQSRGTIRSAEPQYMLISSPKKSKYNMTGGHPSILRNTLINKDMGSGVEVKAEPLMMNNSHSQEEVPSSVASVSVTEFITTEVDCSSDKTYCIFKNMILLKQEITWWFYRYNSMQRERIEIYLKNILFYGKKAEICFNRKFFRKIFRRFFFNGLMKKKFFSGWPLPASAPPQYVNPVYVYLRPLRRTRNSCSCSGHSCNHTTREG